MEKRLWVEIVEHPPHHALHSHRGLDTLSSLVLGDRRWRSLLVFHDWLPRAGRLRDPLARRSRPPETVSGQLRRTCSWRFRRAAESSRQLTASASKSELDCTPASAKSGVNGTPVDRPSISPLGIGSPSTAMWSNRVGTVKDLVVGSGIGFTEWGEHEAEGRPWKLEAVRGGRVNEPLSSSHQRPRCRQGGTRGTRWTRVDTDSAQ